MDNSLQNVDKQINKLFHQNLSTNPQPIIIILFLFYKRKKRNI
ncbi:hypothetical protein HMPREF0658_1674 [Hoylesella marshii DSM 16973 = JCM 13450]|uniref:Uncharacterized protein n=1 Tax=Hoylesella marshii DSM 16973 = JCM 13450 TaxID=862515 RepID=E0NU21_9BACT|nr:hypothetical protein HMPREF0658_1674 [Hoylesella marshii DSM 16973 = JCM 13450]